MIGKDACPTADDRTLIHEGRGRICNGRSSSPFTEGDNGPCSTDRSGPEGRYLVLIKAGPENVNSVLSRWKVDLIVCVVVPCFTSRELSIDGCQSNVSSVRLKDPHFINVGDQVIYYGPPIYQKDLRST